MENRFCPNCGWEGDDVLCPECNNPTESLLVDPETGKPVEKDNLPHDSLKDFEEAPEDDDWSGNPEEFDDE